MNQDSLKDYVKQSAQLMGISTKGEDLSGVVVNFVTIATVASVVNEFPLPKTLDLATEFEP